MESKVYVVICNRRLESNDVFYDETEVVAVYADEEAAEQFCKERNPHPSRPSFGENEYGVEEFDLITSK